MKTSLKLYEFLSRFHFDSQYSVSLQLFLATPAGQTIEYFYWTCISATYLKPEAMPIFIHRQCFQCRFFFFSFQYCDRLIRVKLPEVQSILKLSLKELSWWLVNQQQFLFSNVPLTLSCQLVSINAQSCHVHRWYLVLQCGYWQQL